ncbi:MAG: hypothetical protein KDA65_15120 [Planctomycetaceae bacterium]|nr:hypothetical protein [Planctomycetaceae bacterium]
MMGYTCDIWLSIDGCEEEAHRRRSYLDVIEELTLEMERSASCRIYVSEYCGLDDFKDCNTATVVDVAARHLFENLDKELSCTISLPWLKVWNRHSQRHEIAICEIDYYSRHFGVSSLPKDDYTYRYGFGDISFEVSYSYMTDEAHAQYRKNFEATLRRVQPEVAVIYSPVRSRVLLFEYLYHHHHQLIYLHLLAFAMDCFDLRAITEEFNQTQKKTDQITWDHSLILRMQELRSGKYDDLLSFCIERQNLEINPSHKWANGHKDLLVAILKEASILKELSLDCDIFATMQCLEGVTDLRFDTTEEGTLMLHNSNLKTPWEFWFTFGQNILEYLIQN